MGLGASRDNPQSCGNIVRSGLKVAGRAVAGSFAYAVTTDTRILRALPGPEASKTKTSVRTSAFCRRYAPDIAAPQPITSGTTLESIPGRPAVENFRD